MSGRSGSCYPEEEPVTTMCRGGGVGRRGTIRSRRRASVAAPPLDFFMVGERAGGGVQLARSGAAMAVSWEGSGPSGGFFFFFF